MSSNKFLKLNFEDFKKLSKDDNLSIYEKIGFPDSYRKEKESVEKNISYAVLFGLILIPKDYYYFVSIGDLVTNNYTSIAVILNPILIYSLTVLLFFDIFKYVKDYFTKTNLK